METQKNRDKTIEVKKRINSFNTLDNTDTFKAEATPDPDSTEHSSTAPRANPVSEEGEEIHEEVAARAEVVAEADITSSSDIPNNSYSLTGLNIQL